MFPSYEQIESLQQSGTYKIAPVAEEVLSDFCTPVSLIPVLKNVSEHVFLLESCEDRKRWGRYSFLGYAPKLLITCRNGRLRIGSREVETREPSRYIRELLSQYRSPKIPGMPPFTGGLVGYFSYDSLKYQEPSLKLDARDDEDFQDIDLMLFDRVIAFDNYRQKLILIVNVDLSGGRETYQKAEQEIQEMRELIRHGVAKPDQPGHLESGFRMYFDRDKYCSMVEKAKHYIHEGDIFQIVLSNRLDADYSGSLFNTYRVLRTLNPSPYLFYFSSADLEVAGASPETLVKLVDGTLSTFPLAGTRPRGKTEAEDQEITEELLHDEKELAEHNMLVDLGRNDLGRISQFGTIKVEHFHKVEYFSHVMHISSTVRGQIRPELDALDAVGSVLPAGTLSGAPKIRACQLINELEGVRRGIYGGGVGYLDFSGNLDLAIGIRLACRKNGRVFVRAGAGIVADSVPQREFEECRNKAEAVVEALKQAEEIL